MKFRRVILRYKFTKKNKQIINTFKHDSLLNILTVDKRKDSIIIRKKYTDIEISQITTKEYKRLIERMLHTVQHPDVGGVGIAAPQIGINKRIVGVQRFDNKGEPFEIYPNIHIDNYSGSKKTGREGCLSVPHKYGNVERNDTITICYIDHNTLKPIKETINGFTEVILQHEVNHLAVIIYTYS